LFLSDFSYIIYQNVLTAWIRLFGGRNPYRCVLMLISLQKLIIIWAPAIRMHGSRRGTAKANDRSFFIDTNPQNGLTQLKNRQNG
jgi:hypothetical protein